jgi:Ribonucleotide reductase, alpha subunit
MKLVPDLKLCQLKKIIDGTIGNLYEGVKEAEVFQSAVFSARALIEGEPNYTYVAARLLLDQLRWEVHGSPLSHAEMSQRYPQLLKDYIQTGIDAGLLDPKLSQFDLDKIGAAIDADRDLKFQYLGLRTLADRYLIHVQGKRIELPQTFWMRVAMGLSLEEKIKKTKQSSSTTFSLLSILFLQHRLCLIQVRIVRNYLLVF